MRRLARLLVLGCLVAATLALGACGDAEESASAGPSPAVVVPADSPIYAEAVVRPEGEDREQVEAALERLLATGDPGQEITGLIDDQLSSLSYAEDVEPWLGERAGIFFLDFEDDSNGAFVLETTDSEAAMAAARQNLEDENEGAPRESSYEGVEILRAGDVDAAAIVDEYLLIGSQPGVEAAIDASSGDSFAESEAFANEFDELRSDALMAAYANPEMVIGALVESGEIPAALEGQLASPEFLGLDPAQPMLAALAVDEDLISLELSFAAEEGTTFAATELLEDLPADSWLAMGIADYGEGLATTLDSLEAQEKVLGERPPGGLQAFIERESGLDLKEDVIPWLGALAGYARGTSVVEIGGAVVAETSDESASAAALETLRGALESKRSVRISDLGTEGEGFTISPADVPIPFPVVQRDGKVVAAMGERSAEDAFSTDDRLGDSEEFQAARDSMSDSSGASMYVDFEPLFQLVETVPEAGDDPDYRQAQPYLEALDFLIAGALEEGDGELDRFRMGLGLRDE